MPIVSRTVVGATGVKPIKLKHQLYADLNLNEETYSCVFIIIPKLNKICILDADLHKKLKGRIDMDENYIVLRNENKQIEIKFVNNEEKSIRLIHEINMEPNEELINVDLKDLTIEDNYQNKNEECELLDEEEKTNFGRF